MKKDILSLLPNELEEELQALHEPRFRAKQIFSWLHRGIRDFELMSCVTLKRCFLTLSGCRHPVSGMSLLFRRR